MQTNLDPMYVHLEASDPLAKLMADKYFKGEVIDV